LKHSGGIAESNAEAEQHSTRRRRGDESRGDTRYNSLSPHGTKQMASGGRLKRQSFADDESNG
jgi:hypothetical protein